MSTSDSNQIEPQFCSLHIVPLKRTVPFLGKDFSKYEALNNFSYATTKFFSFGTLDSESAKIQLHTNCRRAGLTLLLKEPLDDTIDHTIHDYTPDSPSWTQIDFTARCGDLLNLTFSHDLLSGVNVIRLRFRYSPGLSSGRNLVQLGQCKYRIPQSDNLYHTAIQLLRHDCEISVYIQASRPLRASTENLIRMLYDIHHMPNEIPKLFEEFCPQEGGWGSPGDRLRFGSRFPNPGPRCRNSGVKSEPAQYAFINDFDYEVTSTLAIHYEQVSENNERSVHESLCSGIWLATAYPVPKSTFWFFGLDPQEYAHSVNDKYGSSFPIDITLCLKFINADLGIWSATRNEHAELIHPTGKTFSVVVIAELIHNDLVKVPKEGQTYEAKFHISPSSSLRKQALAVSQFAKLNNNNKQQLPWGDMKYGLTGIHNVDTWLQIGNDSAKHQGWNRIYNDLKGRCNSDQQHAFHAALNPTNRITLIEGPPGTGKSKTIAAIAVMLAIQGHNVLLCGSSNLQLDDLARKCQAVKDSLESVEGNDFLVTRLYPPHKEYVEMMNADEEIPHNPNTDWAASLSQNYGQRRIVQLRELTVTHHINAAYRNADPKYGKLMALHDAGHKLHPLEYDTLNKYRESLQLQVFNQTRIMVATCEAAAMDLLKAKTSHFSHVIVDEACQVTEATTLLPMMWCHMSIRSLLLVGDTNQLPAVVRSLGCNPFSSQLQLSLFERLRHLGFPTYSLTTQYRMCPQILDYPNRQFYKGKLSTGYSPTSYSVAWDDFCRNQHWPTGLVALYSGNTTAEKTVSNSWYNIQNVSFVLDILTRIRTDTLIAMSEVTILTPYKAQVRIYQDTILQRQNDLNSLEGVRVSTIDSFQGRESGIVILDLVVTADGRADQFQVKMGFMSKGARLNVGLTRAKYGLVVIADRPLMRQVEQYSAIKPYANYLNKEHRVRPARLKERRREVLSSTETQIPNPEDETNPEPSLDTVDVQTPSRDAPFNVPPDPAHW